MRTCVFLLSSSVILLLACLASAQETKSPPKVSFVVRLAAIEPEDGLRIIVDRKGRLFGRLGKEISDELLEKIITSAQEKVAYYHLRFSAPKETSIHTVASVLKKFEEHAKKSNKITVVNLVFSDP